MKMKLIDKIQNMVDKPESYIKTGKVWVNNQKIENINYVVKNTDDIKIIKSKKYVSRGAYKLLEAIKKFNLIFKNKIVLDIGSSTGGFTDVVLKEGAKKVYAVDSGTNQLDFSLRRNKKVQVFEKTNLKNIKKSMFNENIEMVVVDVSFISLRRVFDVLIEFNNIKIMALIKPQFEAFKDEVLSGGFVEESLHKKIIEKIKKYALDKGYKFIAIYDSPLTGKKVQNKEYISLFTKE